MQRWRQAAGRLTLLLAAATGEVFAQRDLQQIPDTDPELERQSFVVADGFEVNLFAADPQIAKPIQMNFDERGRLWIASSEVYPHIRPGQSATDKILVVEDRDHDGRADETTVFASGLLIPTGVVPGDGGAYVANSTELLHLADTNGDGAADRRRVVLSGFGTEDTHHLLHTLRWGHDGCLYMNQSIYIHSHIETPYGVRRLNGGGIWRFRPETMELEVLCEGFVNPWGHVFDDWGQSFATDGAYREGINYLFPGAVFFTAPGATRILAGLNPGSPKHCGLEILSGGHLPDAWQGNMLTNDFRAHRVCRFIISEDGAGYASRQATELIKSTHVAFRPIDVKLGPDGAIYIADWYNPIIQHGEVDFRDERRDQVHGRIWRVVAKGRPLLEPPALSDASVARLLDMLKAPEAWNRLHAKLILKTRDRQQVLSQLSAWLQALDAGEPGYEHHRLEVLWLYQCLREVNRQLVEELADSDDHRVRAAALRVLADWHGRLSAPLPVLAAGAVDPHPRVRLEAVRGLAKLPTLDAAMAAFAAIDLPRDAFLDFAVWKTVRELAPVWLAALREGQLEVSPPQLAYLLSAVDTPEVVTPVLELVRRRHFSPDSDAQMLERIAGLGDSEALGKVFDFVLREEGRLTLAGRADVLDALVRSGEQRGVRPDGDTSRVAGLLGTGNATLEQAALRAAGVWKIESLRQPLRETASDPLAEVASRLAALDALAALGGDSSVETLSQLAAANAPFPVRQRAGAGLARLAAPVAAQHCLALLEARPEDVAVADLVRPLLEREAGPQALARALEDAQLETELAKQLLRAVRTLGRNDEDLHAAIQRAGGLQNARWTLTPELRLRFIEEVASIGDPHRGQAVFRRDELQCLKCHAIGGAGGLVGPDLISLGASAQVDYLIEALIEPNKTIKENYHALVVLTDQGQVLSGIPLRSTDQELVLRDAEDREIVIPVESIEQQRAGRSLMPDGTVDSLTHQELVDLVRFLSELGKVGEFAVGQQRFARSWQTLVWTRPAHRLLNRTSFDIAATDHPTLSWRPEYSLVSGGLPLSQLPMIKPHAETPETSFVRTFIDVSTPGRVRFAVHDTEHLEFWLDGTPTPLDEPLVAELTTGRHQLTFAIDREHRTRPLVVELQDVPDSPAQALMVLGK